MSAIPSEPVYVYEKPVRLWHAVNGLAILVLAATGYLIADPLASPPGEASENYLMGTLRFAHFSAAYILAVGLLGRVYWAFVGNEHARALFLPPVHRGEFWRGVWREARWYLFLEKEPAKHVGHNPLAALALFGFYVLGTLFMIVTGFALYGEGTGAGSWAATAFGWVIPLMGGSQNVHSWHHLGMWYLLVFILIHVYVAIREEHLSDQSMLGTITTGWRRFKDGRP
jgi:Ni/Fe-hydrogenase 1 B-type cytochrome subunit